jgi:glycine dehydrogenase subunit 2
MTERLLFEHICPRDGAAFVSLQPDVPPTPLPDGILTPRPASPEVSELDVIRYFTRLSQINYSIDTGFYPLGSCTMKYNPKINEAARCAARFCRGAPAAAHRDRPGQPALMYFLQEWLKEIGGFSGVTLQPAAGAHGEMTGVMIIAGLSSRPRRLHSAIKS